MGLAKEWALGNDEELLGVQVDELMSSDADGASIPLALQLIERAKRIASPNQEAKIALFIARSAIDQLDARLLVMARGLLDRSVELATDHEVLVDTLAAEILYVAGFVEAIAPSHDPILALKKARELLRMAGLAAKKLEADSDREGLVSKIATHEGDLVMKLHDLGHADAANAIELFEQVLDYRTFDRDPDTWAHMMVKLGRARAMEDSAASGSPSLHGIETYKDSIRGFQAAKNSKGEALALFRAGADMAAYLEANEDSQEFELLVDAIGLATRALELQRAGADRYGLAECLSLMCVLAEFAEQESGEFATEALENVTPRECSELVLKAASILGSKRFDSEDWRGAGEAFQFAADGYLHRSIHSAQDLVAAPDEVGDLFCEWAAYAWVRAGHLEQAIESTEVGANRDLKFLIHHVELSNYIEAVRRQDSTAAEVLANELKSYRSRILEKRPVSGYGDGEQSPPMWNTLVEEVRGRYSIEPPFGEFDLDEFADCLNAGEALCVINSSPAGTAAVVVSVLNGEPQLKAIHSSCLTSRSIADLVLVGDDDVDIEADDDGFVVEHAWSVGDKAGEFLEELRVALLERNITALVLVPTGQNALLPWHCAPFGDGGQLIDDFEVSYSPSASIFSECRHRAQDRSIETAVVIADPIPHVVPLTATRREADLLQGTASTIWFDLRVGHEATTDSFVEEFPHYDTVHLAVHGRSLAMNSRASSGISLADDREIGWAGIARLSSDLSPLIVLSACQGGTVKAYSELDRQFSLPEAFLVAGARGVIARLWPVDDDATAILMTKFYALLAEDQRNPRACLREAQLWMRTATVKEIGAFIGRTKGIKRAASIRSKLLDGDAPYASIDLWASFVFVGA